MYYYNEKYYSEIEDIIQGIDLDCMDESESIEVENCTLQPIITLNEDVIINSLESDLEERYSEDDGESEFNQIKEVLKKNIDFDKLNSELPKLWYPNNTFETYNKGQLIAILIS